MQKYTVDGLVLDDLYKKHPQLKRISFQNILVLTKQEVIVFFCELSQHVSVLSIKAKSFFEVKAHKFEYEFRVERELSK